MEDINKSGTKQQNNTNSTDVHLDSQDSHDWWENPPPPNPQTSGPPEDTVQEILGIWIYWMFYHHLSAHSPLTLG